MLEGTELPGLSVSSFAGCWRGMCRRCRKVTLAHVDPNNRRAELGFALGRPFWGQGYAGEALRAQTQDTVFYGLLAREWQRG